MYKALVVLMSCCAACKSSSAVSDANTQIIDAVAVTGLGSAIPGTAATVGTTITVLAVDASNRTPVASQASVNAATVMYIPVGGALLNTNTGRTRVSLTAFGYLPWTREVMVRAQPTKPVAPPLPTQAATAAAAQPPVAVDGTEDHDIAQFGLTWYIPKTAPPVAPLDRKAVPLLFSIGCRSLSGDLNGSITEVTGLIGLGSPWVDLGLSLGTATLPINGTDPSNTNVMRSARNDSNTFSAVTGIARNYGVELYKAGPTHLFLLGPGLKIYLGAQSGQAINDRTPLTAATASPTVLLAGAILEPVGLRIATCSGIIADIRLTYEGGTRCETSI